MDINDTDNPLANDVTDVEALQIPDVLPMMAVRDVVIFNYMIIPLFVGRPASVSAVQDALAKDKLLLLVTQKEASNDEPGVEDIYSVGMISVIMRTLKLPDGRLKVLVQALKKAKVTRNYPDGAAFSGQGRGGRGRGTQGDPGRGRGADAQRA